MRMASRILFEIEIWPDEFSFETERSWNPDSKERDLSKINPNSTRPKLNPPQTQPKLSEEKRTTKLSEEKDK